MIPGTFGLTVSLVAPRSRVGAMGSKEFGGCPPALLLSLMDGRPGDLAGHLEDWILALAGMTQGAKAVAPSLSEEGAGMLPAGSLRVSPVLLHIPQDWGTKGVEIAQPVNPRRDSGPERKIISWQTTTCTYN